MPRPIRNLNRGFQDKFQASLKAALAFRSACELEALRKQLADEYAKQEELLILQAALANLQAIVADREQALAPTIASERAEGRAKKSGGSGRSAAGTRAVRKRKKRRA